MATRAAAATVITLTLTLTLLTACGSSPSATPPPLHAVDRGRVTVANAQGHS